jgi:hypothetical protein
VPITNVAKASKHIVVEATLERELTLLLHVVDKQHSFESLEGTFLQHYSKIGGVVTPPLADRARTTLLPLIVRFDCFFVLRL